MSKELNDPHVEDLNELLICKNHLLTFIKLFLLEILIEKSGAYSELNGSVSHFLRVKFFGNFFKHFINFEEGWKCVELCIKYYKGACSAYQVGII